MQMYRFFVGIDVSKLWIDVSYHSKNQAIYLNRFDNTPQGFTQFVQQLERLTAW